MNTIKNLSIFLNPGPFKLLGGRKFSLFSIVKIEAMAGEFNVVRNIGFFEGNFVGLHSQPLE